MTDPVVPPNRSQPSSGAARLLEITSDLLVELEASGRISWLSESWRVSLGWELGDLLGTRIRDIVHPEDIPAADRIFDDAVRGRAIRGIVCRCRKRGGGYRWFEWRAMAAAAEGRVHGAGRDVTEIRARDEERSELARQQREQLRLESLGLLVGGVAHDFNNQLATILGSAEIAEAALDRGRDPRPQLKRILRTVEIAQSLCQELLAVAGRNQPTTDLFDLGRLVQDLEPLLGFASQARRARIEIESEDFLPPVEADLSQLRQVLLNLVDNGAKAASEAEDPRVRIRLRLADPEEELRPVVGSLPSPRARLLSLEVEDNGPGVPEEERARIFRPFVSSGLRGRGLGLATVASIVRDHGAAIEVSSSDDLGGARFRVLFRPTESGYVPLVEAAASRGSALVADDEASVRKVVEEVVQGMGLAAVSARDGSDALKRIDEGIADLRIAILDLAMPGADGLEVFRALRDRSPEVPVVLMSGYESLHDLSEARSTPHTVFLRKPFRLRHLREQTETLLESGGPA